MTPAEGPRIRVGLLYSEGAASKWTWYVGTECGVANETRTHALSQLEYEIGRQKLKNYAMGPDRSLTTFLRELGRGHELGDRAPKPKKGAK